MPRIAVFLLTFVVFIPGAFAAAGALDGTFGTGGKVLADIGRHNDHCRSVVFQNDGKMVVAGGSMNGPHHEFALVRFTASGALDSSFGTGGKVTTDIGNNHDFGNNQSFPAKHDFATSVAMQSDGKIVVAGYSHSQTTSGYEYGANIAMARYTTSGTLDGSFGNGGKVTTWFGTGGCVAQSVAIQSDGKVVVAGYAFNASGTDFALVRYTTNGELDSSFGNGGKVITPFSDSDSDRAYSVAIQSDGRIVVAGDVYAPGSRFALVRYTASGELDSSFGNSGKVTTDVGLYGIGAGQSMALQADGKIVVTGFAANAGGEDFALVRYTASGALDSSFGDGGKVTTDLGEIGDRASSVALQPDGKIVVAGHSVAGSSDFALVRYTNEGALDESFGSGGRLRTDFGSGNDRAYSVAVQSDGRIVAAGLARVGSDEDTAIVRYTETGALDDEFGSAGKLTTNTGRGYDNGLSVALQSDGKILMAGDTFNGSDADIALVRWTADGMLDSSFGTGGVLTAPIGNGNETACCVAVQSDGKIVLAAKVDVDNRTRLALVRCTAGGALDTGFGTGGVVITPIHNGDSGQILALQSDGKIVLAGSYLYESGAMLSSDLALVRYTAGGVLDTTFGTGGVVTTDIEGGADWATGAVVQPDGKIVIAGNFYPDGIDSRMVLLRYTSGGVLDGSFGTGGKVTPEFRGPSDHASCVAVQSDGKIVLGGYSHSESPQYFRDFALVRHTSGGALDSSFGTGGIAITSSEGEAFAKSVALQSDGRIVLAGYSFSQTSLLDFALVRYTASGARDGTFGTGGKVTTDIDSSSDSDFDRISFDFGSSVVVQPDGKIVVGGTSQKGGETDFALVRYEDDTVPVGIVLTGNDTGITNGDATPDQPDHTDFGSTAVAGGSVIRTFTVINCGLEALDLTGTAPDYVSLSGSSAFRVTAQPGSGTVPGNGGTATFVITFDPGVTGIHTATVRIDSNDSNNTPFTFAIAGKGLTAQEDWRLLHFHQTSNSGIAADSYDYDGDGLANLIEWACHSNPITSSVLPVNLVRNGENLVFTYARSVTAVNAGAGFIVEWTDSLPGTVPWSTSDVNEQALSDDGTVQTIKSTLPAGSTRRFVRLKVIAPSN